MPNFWEDPNSAWTKDFKSIDNAATSLGYAPRTNTVKEKAFWEDPNSDWTKAWGGAGKGVDDAAVALGYAPKVVDPAAPGGAIDTSRDTEDVNKLNPLITLLQNQANTGGGAWEQQLADATGQARSGAMALGQSMPSSSIGSALRQIGNAQGAADQRAVGQGNILRAQSQAGAQDKLAQLYGNMGAGEANKAQAEAAASQGIASLNANLASSAKKNTAKDTQSMGGMMGSMPFSDGGKVPGRPEVFGDDEKNDTVPAMLSPGEIVIPRSHSGTPADAAAFVAALKGRGVQHLADGGPAGDGTGLSNPADDEYAKKSREAGVASIFLPHVGAAMQPSDQQAPSLKNGALFNTTGYDANRQASLANADQIAKRAAGQGPSIAGQGMQNQYDTNIAGALRAMAQGRSTGVVGGATEANQGAAGSSAGTAAGEQSAGQNSLATALTAQRARDAAFAQAQQQAAFRQTMQNAGLSLAEQAAMRQNLAGAGQAGMAYAGMGGRGGGNNDFAGSNLSFDDGFGSGGDSGGSDVSEWSNPYANESYNGPADLHDSNDLAHGGEVKVKVGKPTINSRVATSETPEWAAKMDQSAAERAELEAAKKSRQAAAEGDFIPIRKNVSVARSDMSDSDWAESREYAKKQSANPTAYAMKAHGGEIKADDRAKAFVAALKRRRA